MRPVNLRAGTATGVGSLPHRQLDAAVAVSLAACPDLPFAPSLPELEPREHMISQGAFGMRGVDVAPDGTVTITGRLDADRPFDRGAEGVDGPAFGALRTFLAAVRHRTSPIKLQVTGPVTLGTALVAAGAEPVAAYRSAAAAVRARVVAMSEEAMRQAPMAPQITFVDEPGLVALAQGRLGIGLDDGIDLVSSALTAIEPFGVTGLHCCGETDWRLALGAGPQIISVPTAVDIAAHAGALGAHLDRGGWVAWGAVPTSGPVGSEPDRLWRSLSETWCELVQRGCEGLALREQALVTPECGLAGHDSLQAESLLSMSMELAERVRRQSFGVRLAVGA